MGSRVRFWAVVAAAITATFTPMQEQISAQSGPGIVISEFRLAGPRGTNDEFVELFNAGAAPVTINGWTLRSANNVNFSGGVSNTFLRATVPLSGPSVVIQPGCYFLIANGASNGYIGSGTAAADLTYTTGIADDGGVAVVRSDGTIADQIGFVNTATGFGFSAYFEGQKIGVTLPVPAQDRSYERKPKEPFVYQDSGDNASDLALITPSRPQNKTATCASLFKYPYEIQGAGASSPLAPGTGVNVKGVVTASTADGFFMQTETASEDADPSTSEGLFVSYAGAAQVGHLVVVSGKVAEFKPPTDPASPTRTQVEAVTSVADLGAAALPAPLLLTAAELSDAGSLAQLERFEGMRVSASQLSAVSGSDLSGAFYAVLTGQPRPFREPGVHASNPVLPCALAPCNVPVFDGNPELLRVDADGVSGVAPVPVSTGVVLNNVTGPLDFASHAYTLLPEADLAPAPGSGMSIVTAAAHASDQFTVASLNLGAAYPERLAKASLALRNVLNYPDVVGVQGVGTVGDLSALAAQVNADAAGEAHYDPHPSTGNAADALGVGFLVRGDRASSAEATQLAGTPFDHAPVVLEVTVQGAPGLLPQDVTLVVSQFASQAGLERADATGDAARAKRQAQADFLADYIQGRQINDPNEAIVSLGDFNAFDFNDGYVDVVGTVRGGPAAEDQVALASAAVVTPALFNPDSLNAWSEQYSSLSNGSAQSLDHVLVNANLLARLAGLAHARINADFPHAFAADPSTPVRLSERDPLVVYFTFPPDVDAPVFAPVADLVAEATGPAGAPVAFATPEAEDNLDATVSVSCNPSTGTQFSLGNTGVTCSAQDAAGNASSVSFTVTVHDTTAPVLTVPSNITAEAASSSGSVVTFSASATDAVTASPAVTCAPSSGSTFPVGETPVTCDASDAAGNNASGSFTVTITAATEPAASGRMSGDGDIGNGNRRVTFAFDVKESGGLEQGWVALSVRDGAGGPDRLTSTRIDDVRFVSSSGGVVDTVLFTGSGCWNGRYGYRFEVAAADHGDPGRGRDTFVVRVFGPNGALVASASDSLRNGDIQLDQSFLKALLRQMAQRLKRH